MSAAPSVMHQWARFYAGLGWHIFPLVPGTKSPFKDSHGSSEATADLAQIDAWWSANPEANIGVKPSAAGLYVFDVDPRNGGTESFARLQIEHGLIDSPLAVDSPGGGFHLYFAAKPDTRYSSAPAGGIDGKFNGYAVLPPSLHPNGSRYAWRNGPQAVAALAPDWLERGQYTKREAVAFAGDPGDLELIGRCLEKLDYTDYHVWVQTIASVKHWQDHCPEAGTGGYELAREWSMQDPRHDDGHFDDKWESFDSFRPGARTLGSLVHDAGLTAAQNMVDAAAAFAQLPQAERVALWTTESRDPFPTGKSPEEVVRQFSMNPDSPFRKACELQDWAKVARQLAWKLGSNCEAVLAGLQVLKVPDTEEVRTLVLAACTATDSWASGDAAVLEGLPPGVKVIAEDDPFYGPEKQIEIFGGYAYVARHNKIATPSGELYEQAAFNAVMPAGIYTMCPKESVTKKPWDVFVGSMLVRFQRVDDVAFRPDMQPGHVYAEEGVSFFNRYVPYTAPRREGDASPFLKHIALMLPDPRDQQILLTWMAAVVQNPGRKFRWAPVLQGWEGNGKGILQDTMQRAVGRKYTHLAQAADIGNKFNAWIVGKLLICVSEVNASHDLDVIDALKPMVSDDFVAVQGKGADQATARNFANFIFSTNRAGAMGKAVEGRRYAVFYTAQQTAEDVKRDMPNAYFVQLHQWLANGGHEIAINFLATMPLIDEFNPAGLAIDAPRTSSFEASKVAALGSVEQALMDAVAEGRAGFRGGFIGSHGIKAVLQELRKENRVAPNRRREVMKSLGYDWHPALVEGRATRASKVDGCKEVIFVKLGHPAAQLQTAAQVMAKYEEAQIISGDDSIFSLRK